MRFLKYIFKVFLLLLIAKPLFAEISQDANKCIDLTKTHHSFQYQFELKPKEAREVCERAFEKDPENVEVRYGLSRVYYKLGLYTKEQEQLKYLLNAGQKE